MIKKIDIITSTCIPLPQENVDTDQIIPARFLKAVSREGFGENLFRDWRFDKAGQPIRDFILNNPLYSGSILVAGKNFGSVPAVNMLLGYCRIWIPSSSI